MIQGTAGVLEFGVMLITNAALFIPQPVECKLINIITLEVFFFEQSIRIARNEYLMSSLINYQ